MATEPHAGAHHGPTATLYLAVFAALSIFTVVSFVVYGMVQTQSVTAFTGFLIIMGVAVVKALLVAMIFMHLKYDWGNVYFLIIPAMILGALLITVLMPDIVLAWKH